MYLKIKVKTQILFLFLMTPIVFLFAFGMFMSRTSEGEIFLPFLIVSVILFLIGIFATLNLIEMITQKKVYEFNIKENELIITRYINNKEDKKFYIQKNNLKSFKNHYKDNYGAVTTTYEFYLKSGSSIHISENFGKDEKEIMDAFLLFGYIPKWMINKFDEKNMIKR